MSFYIKNKYGSILKIYQNEKKMWWKFYVKELFFLNCLFISKLNLNFKIFIILSTFLDSYQI